MSDLYDAIIIGAGPGGHAAALEAARCGAKVAIIEKDGWGGTCTHKGCIPTKALLVCSKKYNDMKKLKRLGILTGEYTFDFPTIKKHQQQMIRISALGIQKSLKDAGVDLKAGEGKILAPDIVQYTSQEGDEKNFKADNIIIAWGSEPLVLPGIEITKHVLTSDGVLAWESLPESVVIVGGSVIGVEFATFLAELNVRVTLIELMDRLLPYEDEDAAELLKQELIRLGVAVHVSARLDSLQETAAGVLLKTIKQTRQLELIADYVLISTGRTPRLFDDQLNQMGIQYGKGGISVSQYLMTNIEGIYALGDVTGGMMLAHRAIHQGKALANHLFGDHSLVYREDTVPSVVYSHPNIARVGLTEKMARGQGLDVEIIRSEYAANIIARTELQSQGFVKNLFHKDKLVGATIMGEDASELIAPMSLAVAAGLGKGELKQWIIPHPSLSEILI